MRHYSTINNYYLAGPMAGFPQFNHPEFHQMAIKLRMCGHSIINPAEFGNQAGLPWQQVMKRDIHALMWTDAVIVLDGWEQSDGARFEVGIAWQLHMPIFPYQVMLCQCSELSSMLVDDGDNIRVQHTDGCVARRVPLSSIPPDDLTALAVYARTSGAGADVQKTAQRVMKRLDGHHGPEWTHTLVSSEIGNRS